MTSLLPMPEKRIFSGIQPTGNLHLGNYLGAIRNWVTLQDDFESIYCVVDLHAITVAQDPQQLRQSTREVAASLIAAGISPERSVLFNQSSVPQHSQLAWVFNCIARLGWLNRMTQFKEKAGKNRENATVGLYSYPTLMAADILAYRATHVPVGEDQKQHLELTRDIAQGFNQTYGVEFFPPPEPQIFGSATRVMSLRDGNSKMSKSDASDNSRINMTDDADLIAQKIRKAKTIPTPFRPRVRVWKAGLRRRTSSVFLPRLPIVMWRACFPILPVAVLVSSSRHLPNWPLPNWRRWVIACASCWPIRATSTLCLLTAR